jgi:hypothetical protein
MNSVFESIFSYKIFRWIIDINGVFVASGIFHRLEKAFFRLIDASANKPRTYDIIYKYTYGSRRIFCRFQRVGSQKVDAGIRVERLLYK